MENTQLAAGMERLTDSLGPFPEPVANPVFVVVSGLPGTGKTYFSSKLAERLPFLILESDALRKILFSTPTHSAQESSLLFQTIHRLIEKLLKSGISVILDATNLTEQHREHLYHIADRVGVKLIMVQVEAPAELVRARLKARVGSIATKSDADWSVYQKMKPSVEGIRRKHYVVDTSRDISPVLQKIAREASH